MDENFDSMTPEEDIDTTEEETTVSDEPVDSTVEEDGMTDELVDSTLEEDDMTEDIDVADDSSDDTQDIPDTDEVESTIESSPDLVSALESVGAMYCIPSSKIMADNSLNKIKVVNDCMIAPPVKNCKGNTKAIMCAIGSVLDYISQRVDEKLDEYQHCMIEKGKNDEVVNKVSDPNKGTVIGRYVDPNGDEILVYDSGIVDKANTKEANDMVDKLREDMKIPEYNPITKQEPGYFSDEDDITNGVDMTADQDEVPINEEEATHDIAKAIGESATHLEWISKFDNTTHLGYDLLQAQGFNYVKPMESMYQEADDNKSKIKPADIKYMKFDNKEIINAINHMNDARAEQKEAKNKDLDLKKLVNSPSWTKAINCLNKQFDATINVRFFKAPAENAMTPMYDDIKHNLKISKSKGFQLNGLPIDIYIIGNISKWTSEDQSIFGQSIVSIMLHEIFHNISLVMKGMETWTKDTLGIALASASAAKTGKERRIIITNYVNTLDAMDGMKLTRIQKKALVKHLCIIASANRLDDIVAGFKNKKKKKGSKKKDEENTKIDPNEEVDKLIKQYEKTIKRTKAGGIKAYIGDGVIAALGVMDLLYDPFKVGSIAGVLATSIGFSKLVVDMTYDATFTAVQHKYAKGKYYEEFYCDMFAAMYQLPVRFFINFKTGVVPNKVDKDKLDKLTKLDKEVSKLLMTKYPSTMERNHAGVKAAKKLLEDKDLDPAIKKYCQWIVDNYSSVLDTDIDEIYNSNVFDPKTAEDLDKHLEKLIKDNGIVLTESLTWILDNSDIISE